MKYLFIILMLMSPMSFALDVTARDKDTPAWEQAFNDRIIAMQDKRSQLFQKLWDGKKFSAGLYNVSKKWYMLGRDHGDYHCQSGRYSK